MVIFHSYVSLPEGIHQRSLGLTKNDLVGGCLPYPSEKYEFVNGKDYHIYEMDITCSKPPTSLISKIQVFEPEWKWFLHVCPLELRSKKNGMERTIGVSQIPGFILKFHMEVS
jgi:hypothetical protein